MEAFEKWFNEILEPTGNEKGYCMVAWRAALEWYKRTMDDITDHDIGISGEEVINKELGEQE